MAVYTGYISGNPVPISTTRTWANNIGSSGPIAFGTSTVSGWSTDFFPSPGDSNISVGDEIDGNRIFYGTIHAKSNMSVQVTLPYTGTSVTAGNSQVVKNVSYNDYGTVRFVASPTYPYIFQKWTSDPDGNTTVSTSATLDLNAITSVSVSNFYAHATSPATHSATLKYSISSASDACITSTTRVVYWPQDDGSNFYQAYKLYTNSTLTSNASSGFYSDGTTAVTVSTGVVSNAVAC